MFWNKFKFAAAVVLACVATATAADAPNPKEKLGVVRQIDLKKFKANWPVGSVYKPTEIRTAEELGKFDVNADKDLLAQLVEKVDFTKERLVFMAWSGWAEMHCPSRWRRAKKVHWCSLNTRWGKPTTRPRIIASMPLPTMPAGALTTWQAPPRGTCWPEQGRLDGKIAERFGERERLPSRYGD